MAEQNTSVAPSPFPYDDPATSDIEIGLTFDRPIIQSPVAQPITTVPPKVSNWKVFGDSISSGIDDLQGTFGEGLGVIGNYLSSKAGNNIGLQNIGSDFSKWGEAMRLRNREEAARRQAALPGARTYKEMYSSLGEGRLNDAWQYVIKAIGRQGPMLATYAAAYAAGKTPAGFGLSAFYHSMENYREQLEEAGETDPMAIGYAALTNSMLDVLLIGRVSRLFPGGKPKYNKYIKENLDQPWLKDKMKGVMGALAYGGGVEGMQELNNLVTTRYVKENQISFGWDDVFSDRVIEAVHQGAIVAMPFGLFYRSPSQASDAIEAAPPKEGILSRYRKILFPPDAPITPDSGVSADAPVVDPDASGTISETIAKKKADAGIIGRSLGRARVRRERDKKAAEDADAELSKMLAEEESAAVDAVVEAAEVDSVAAADAAFESVKDKTLAEIEESGESAAIVYEKEKGPKEAKIFRKKFADRIKKLKEIEAARISDLETANKEIDLTGPGHLSLIGQYVVRRDDLTSPPKKIKRVYQYADSDTMYIELEDGSKWPSLDATRVKAPVDDKPGKTTDPKEEARLDATIAGLQEKFGAIFGERSPAPAGSPPSPPREPVSKETASPVVNKDPFDVDELGARLADIERTRPRPAEAPPVSPPLETPTVSSIDAAREELINEFESIEGELVDPVTTGTAVAPRRQEAPIEGEFTEIGGAIEQARRDLVVQAREAEPDVTPEDAARAATEAARAETQAKEEAKEKESADKVAREAAKAEAKKQKELDALEAKRAEDRKAKIDEEARKNEERREREAEKRKADDLLAAQEAREAKETKAAPTKKATAKEKETAAAVAALEEAEFAAILESEGMGDIDAEFNSVAESNTEADTSYDALNPEGDQDPTDISSQSRRALASFIKFTLVLKRSMEQSFRTELTSIFGAESTKSMIDSGFINFVKRDDMKNLMPDYNHARDYNYTMAWVSRGKVYFTLDNIESREVRGLIFHEIGVHYGKGIWTDSQWTDIKKSASALLKKEDRQMIWAFRKAANEFKVTEYKGLKNVEIRKLVEKALNDPQSLLEDGYTKQDIDRANRLWEEVIAYYIQANPPESNPSLYNKIKRGVEDFLQRLAVMFNPDYTGKRPEISAQDLRNTVAHMTARVPALVKRRADDSNRVSNQRDTPNKKFLDGSLVTDPIYIIEASGIAAASNIANQSKIVVKVKGIEGIIPEGSVPKSIDAFRDRYEMYDNSISLTNEDGTPAPVEIGGASEGVTVNYTANMSLNKDGVYELTIKSPSGRKDTVTLKSIYNSKNDKDIAGAILGENSNISVHAVPNVEILQGYVNVKKPLDVKTDIFSWDSPSSWSTYLKDAPADIKKLMGSFIREEVKNNPNASTDFSNKLKYFLGQEGYDSISFIKFDDDSTSRSYIVFNDNQMQSLGSLDADVGTMRASRLGETLGDSNKSWSKITKDATDSFAQSVVGQSAAWHKVKEFGRLFDPWITLEGSDTLKARRYLAQGEIGIKQNLARQIYDIFDQASQEEKKSIYKFFTTKDASPSLVPSLNVNFATRETFGRGRRLGGRKRQVGTVNMRDKAVEVKKEIENLGQELVNMGLMDSARYESLKNRYLPNTYLRYLIDPELRRSLGAGLRPSSMDYTKARKLHDQWIADVLFGKIEDPAFLASRYYGQVTRDLAIVKYLEWVATDPAGKGWVIPGELVLWRGNNVSPGWLLTESANLRDRAEVMRKESPERAEEMIEASKEMQAAAQQTVQEMPGKINIGHYKKIPTQSKFGKFGGMHVRKEIFGDVMALSETQTVDNPIANLLSDKGWGGMIQRAFKYTRVIMNPPTQIRNLISNMVLLQTSGVPLYNGDVFRYLSKAMNEIINDGKYYQLAQKYGIEGTSFTAQEIGRIDMEYRKVVAKASTAEGFKSRAAIFFNDYVNPLGRFYQKSEVVFKLAKFMHSIEAKGIKPDQAALDAQDAILDYSSVSETVRWLRRVPYGAPFVTFNVKVLPQLMKNLKNNPASFIPYIALPFMYAAWLAEENDVTEEDFEKLKGHFGEWARDRDNMYFLPSKDKNGKWTAVDIGYMLPWTGWVDLAKSVSEGELGEAYKGTGFFTGPIDLLIGLKTNHDPFTGQPIWNESDPPQQRYEDSMHFMASYIVPPFLMPRNKAGDQISGGGPIVKLLMATDAIDGNTGKDGLPRYSIPQALMSMFGINTYKLSPSSQLNLNAYFSGKEMKAVVRRWKYQMMDPNTTVESAAELRESMMAHLQNLIDDQVEYNKLVSGMDAKLY
jgi:hypothetical protein